MRRPHRARRRWRRGLFGARWQQPSSLARVPETIWNARLRWPPASSDKAFHSVSPSPHERHFETHRHFGQGPRPSEAFHRVSHRSFGERNGTLARSNAVRRRAARRPRRRDFAPPTLTVAAPKVGRRSDERSRTAPERRTGNRMERVAHSPQPPPPSRPFQSDAQTSNGKPKGTFRMVTRTRASAQRSKLFPDPGAQGRGLDQRPPSATSSRRPPGSSTATRRRAAPRLPEASGHPSVSDARGLELRRLRRPKPFRALVPRRGARQSVRPRTSRRGPRRGSSTRTSRTGTGAR